jgi:hypothetical protein
MEITQPTIEDTFEEFVAKNTNLIRCQCNNYAEQHTIEDKIKKIVDSYGHSWVKTTIIASELNVKQWLNGYTLREILHTMGQRGMIEYDDSTKAAREADESTKWEPGIVMGCEVACEMENGDVLFTACWYKARPVEECGLHVTGGRRKRE